MRILHINSYLNGGSFYKSMYEDQIARGWDIRVYVPVAKDKELHSEIDDSYSIVSPCFKNYHRYIFPWKKQLLCLDLESKVDLKSYDLLHAHSLFTNGAVAYQVYKKYKIPYVVTVRNTDLNVFFKKQWYLRPYGVKIMKNAEQIIFLSKSYQEEIIGTYVPVSERAQFEKKSVVIPNGLHPFWLQNQQEPRKLRNQNELRLISVGNISKNKNIGLTLNTVDLLNEEGIETTLLSIGRVKDQELYKKVSEHPKADYVPFTQRETLREYYNKCDILMLPSFAETFGNVYIEALSQGLPVIYTKSQGFFGQFEEGVVGFGVDPEDPKDCKDKILSIYKDYEAFSKRSVSGAQKYNWKNINDSYEKIFKKIMRGGKLI